MEIPQCPAPPAVDLSLLIVEDERPFLTPASHAPWKVGTTRSRRRDCRGRRGNRPGGTAGFRRHRHAAFRRQRARRRGGDPGRSREDSRIIILTGYGNIATAVTAVKLGAIDYLSKPADADEIHAPLTRVPGDLAPPPENPMSAGSRAVGTHPARLRDVRAERVGDGAPAQHAPPYAAADSWPKRAPR